MTADVIVIGGGIHGCAVAWELALRGRSVTVLERSVPGAEASSAAGGILGPNLEAGPAPTPFDAFATYSMVLYPEWVARLEEQSGVSVGFDRCGGMLTTFRPDGLAELQAHGEQISGRGVPAYWKSASELRELEPALGEALGGIHFPNEAQIEPRALMRALPIAARRAGAEFVTDTVHGIESGPGGIEVQCAGGARTAPSVVLAAGAWSATMPGVGLPADSVKPARGQMISLRLPEPPCRAIVFSDRGYIVPRRDGRVLTGSTLEFVGFRKAVTASGLREMLDLGMEIAPAMAEAELIESWSGFRPYTDDHLPILGRGGPDGLWLSTGHYRNGILLAPGSAMALADEITGGEAAVDLAPFSPERLRAS
ncbi:MAG: glycine oxidase ThiO [Proteobacteria bacterium]|nr:glycine oxidase ThiO [Pseudomonadota bacterium]